MNIYLYFILVATNCLENTQQYLLPGKIFGEDIKLRQGIKKLKQDCITFKKKHIDTPKHKQFSEMKQKCI